MSKLENKKKYHIPIGNIFQFFAQLFEKEHFFQKIPHEIKK